MNSPRVREYASAFANRLSTETSDDLVEVLNAGYLAALGRKPDQSERTVSLAFVQAQETAYREANQVNPRLLALTDFAQSIFGLNEFSYLR